MIQRTEATLLVDKGDTNTSKSLKEKIEESLNEGEVLRARAEAIILKNKIEPNPKVMSNENKKKIKQFKLKFKQMMKENTRLLTRERVRQ